MSKRKELAALHEQTDALTAQTNHMLNRNKEKLAERKASLPTEYRERFAQLKEAAEEAASQEATLANDFTKTVRGFNLAARDFRDLIDDILGGSLQ